MKRTVALLFLFLCLMLCGCDLYQPDVESLLSAPLLSDLQNHVDDALRDVVGQDIKLKYPASGDYRSPYIFFDLDRDGEEEALVLYSLENDSSITYLQILDRVDGSWQAGSALPGSGSEIEFVCFPRLLQSDEITLLIGWQNADDENYSVSIYRCSANRLTSIFETTYSQIALSDFNGDGLEELLIAFADSSSVELRLFADNGSGKAEIVDSATASLRMLSLQEPVIGQISDTLSGVVIDGMVSSSCMASLLVGVSQSRLILPQETLSAVDYTQTYRYTGVHSEDINGDGIIEIPVGVQAAGYTGYNVGDPIIQYFTDYRAFTGTEFRDVISTYENLSSGYRFILPQAFMDYYRSGELSIYRQAETQEAFFFLYRGSLTERSEELLRLRVVSAADYLDKFDSERYTLLQKRGQFEYYVYLPTAAEPALTVEEVHRSFSLLN